MKPASRAGEAELPVPSPDVWPVPPMSLPPLREPDTLPEVAEPPLPGGPDPVKVPGREQGSL